jgi:hypothetical protein
MRTTRPRVTGVVCVILAVILAAIGALLLWAGSSDGALLGPALAALALAAVCLAIAVLAFRLAGGGSGTPGTGRGPQLLAILAFAIGTVGAALGIILGVTQSSYPAIGAGAGVLLASITVALQGALVYGATTHRA